MLRYVPTRLVSMILEKSSEVPLRTLPTEPAPAEFTASCSGPNCFTVSATPPSSAASEVTSQTTQAAREPSLSAAARKGLSRRPASITLPPPSTIAWAQAKPVPVAPPVTKATFPSNRPCAPAIARAPARPASRLPWLDSTLREAGSAADVGRSTRFPGGVGSLSGREKRRQEAATFLRDAQRAQGRAGSESRANLGISGRRAATIQSRAQSQGGGCAAWPR